MSETNQVKDNRRHGRCSELGGMYPSKERVAKKKKRKKELVMSALLLVIVWDHRPSDIWFSDFSRESRNPDFGVGFPNFKILLTNSKLFYRCG